MLEEIANPDLLLYHAQQLQKKNFKPGFDGMRAQALCVWLELNADKLCRQLLRGTYDPMPALSFRTAKFDGTYRQLVKLSALDMAIQGGILGCLVPICQHLLPENVCAYLPGRGVQTAVEQFCTLSSQYPYAAKLDPTACFDNIDHTVLKDTLHTLLSDPALTELIMRYVRMPVIIDKKLTHPQKGVLQGAPLSNLLCNLYFVPLDEYLRQQDIPFIRYADDIVIFASSREEAKVRQSKLADFMRERLKLKENKKKSQLSRCTDMTYLGIRFERTKSGISAIDDNADKESAISKNWQICTPANPHRTLDILSDGILRQKDLSLAFESADRTTPIPVKATDILNVYSSVILDSHFLQRAMENSITVNIFDRRDKLIGRFIPNTPMPSPQIPHKQLQAYFDPAARLHLARQFVQASVHNSKLNIRYYARHRESEVFSDALKRISELEKQIRRCDSYENLLLLEARAKGQYYRCFDDFLASTCFRFEKRTKRPPHNEINAMISFGNTVLYNYIATQIYQTHLDIRIGFLHAANRRLESLNLDIAEAYKPLIVDRVAFSSLNLKSIQSTDFIHTEDQAVFLSEVGKRKFLRAFYEKLETRITINADARTYRRIITEDVQALVRHFRNGEDYRSFRQVK